MRSRTVQSKKEVYQMDLIQIHSEIYDALKQILENGHTENDLACQMFTWCQGLKKAVKEQRKVQEDTNWFRAKLLELEDKLKNQTEF